MTKVSIFGKGNMGQTIGGNFETAGNEVNYITSSSAKTELGEIVVLAVPFGAVSAIISEYKADLAGKTVIDITNPLNFETFDELVVPSDSSAAAVFAKELPESHVVKGFNTNFAATLGAKTIGDHQTTVLLAGDSEESKKAIISALVGSGLAVIDAGSLKRARELESVGFLQLTLAASEKISWTGGFGVFN